MKWSEKVFLNIIKDYNLINQFQKNEINVVYTFRDIKFRTKVEFWRSLTLQNTERLGLNI